MKKPTLFERYLDWAVRPGQPTWHEPVLVIGTSVLISSIVMGLFLYFLLR